MREVEENILKFLTLTLKRGDWLTEFAGFYPKNNPTYWLDKFSCFISLVLASLAAPDMSGK
jgi:hypothetical protein